MENNIKKTAILSAVLALFSCNLNAAIDISVTPNTAWDVGTGGVVDEVNASPYMIQNKGEAVNINVKGTDSVDWHLAGVPGLNTFATKWNTNSNKEDVNWNSIYTTDTSMFPSLGAGLSQEFYLRYLSPKYISPNVTNLQSTTIKLTAVSSYVGAWVLAKTEGLFASGPYAMVVGSDNKVHVVYYDGVSMQLKYFKWDGIGQPLVQSNIDPAKITMDMPRDQISLSLDSNGSPHVMYVGKYTDGASPILKYARFDGEYWVVKPVDFAVSIPQGDPYAASISFILDSGNNPHVAYPSADGSNSLKYAVSNDGGTNWATTDVDTGSSCSLKLDSKGNPHIAYYTGVGQEFGYLKYAVWDSIANQWVKNSVDTTELSGLYPKLALDSKDSPYIAYTYNDNNGVGAVKLAKLDNEGHWGVNTILSSEGYPSMALDGSGYPVMAFRDYQNNQMAYFRWTGTEWLPSVLSTDISSEAILGLDYNGRPHIVYTDSQAQFEYAKWE